MGIFSFLDGLSLPSATRQDTHPWPLSLVPRWRDAPLGWEPQVTGQSHNRKVDEEGAIWPSSCWRLLLGHDNTRVPLISLDRRSRCQCTFHSVTLPVDCLPVDYPDLQHADPKVLRFFKPFTSKGGPKGPWLSPQTIVFSIPYLVACF